MNKRACNGECHADCGSDICLYCLEKEKEICPNCGTGRPGRDALCEECWKEFLGQNIGGR